MYPCLGGMTHHFGAVFSSVVCCARSSSLPWPRLPWPRVSSRESCSLQQSRSLFRCARCAVATTQRNATATHRKQAPGKSKMTLTQQTLAVRLRPDPTADTACRSQDSAAVYVSKRPRRALQPTCHRACRTLSRVDHKHADPPPPPQLDIPRLTGVWCTPT